MSTKGRPFQKQAFRFLERIGFGVEKTGAPSDTTTLR